MCSNNPAHEKLQREPRSRFSSDTSDDTDKTPEGFDNLSNHQMLQREPRPRFSSDTSDDADKTSDGFDNLSNHPLVLAIQGNAGFDKNIIPIVKLLE